MTTLGSFVVSFFRTFLVKQKGCTPNTIASYSDCIRLLLCYACERFELTFDKLDLEQLNDQLILDFLDYLEQERRNKTKTRNQRLAAIKAFFRFLASQDPMLTEVCERVCAIRAKKTGHKVIVTLEKDEVKKILSVSDDATLLGARDKALLTFLYNTGARVQEAVDLNVSELRMEKPLQVVLSGKGRKQRIVPLYEETVSAIQHYLKLRRQAGIESEALFLNALGQRITRYGIGTILSKHATQASRSCPSLQRKKVTPHTYRHTIALHLIQSGSDISVVKEWLGHADLKTTSLYVNINIEMMRKALEACPPPAVPQTDGADKPLWHDHELLLFLEDLSRISHLELC
jgi:site-specific recombinase XerD